MVIKCENKEKFTAVLNKMESETSIKWADNDKPTDGTAIDLDKHAYPLWLIIDKNNRMTFSEWRDNLPFDKNEMSDDEFLALDLTLSPKSEYAEAIAYDPVNHPSHYTQGKVECIDAMEQTLGTEVVKGFCLGNCFKYLWRHEDKNGQEDVSKAVWYFNRFKQIVNR